LRQVSRDGLGTCETQLHVQMLVARGISVSGYFDRRIAASVGQRDDALQYRHCRTAKGRCRFVKIHRPGIVVRKRARTQCGNVGSFVRRRYGETSRFHGSFRADAVSRGDAMDTETDSGR